MLSRPKLVQDWNRRLAAAEAEGAQKHSLKWLYQMRVRLYRFLLSCYRQQDWRADKPSTSAEDTLADVPHGDTTTILDCPLDGKPAKHAGKMLAVLKSVSAAQDHPAESGPLLDGVAADEWVVAVSPRDKLRMNRCQDLLRQYGIASTWTLQEELTVRLFDLERATQLIRTFREDLKVRSRHVYHSSSPPPLILPDWAIQLAFPIVFLAPVFAICGLMLTQCLLAGLSMPLLEGPNVGSWFAICYFVGMELCALSMLLRSVRRRREWRRETRTLAEGERSTEY